MKIGLCAIIIIIISGCIHNSSGDNLDVQIKDAETEFDSLLNKSRAEISKLYETNITIFKNDTTIQLKLNELSSVFQKADKFISYLHVRLKSLNEKNVNSVQIVKNFLGEGKSGDTLRSYLTETINKAYTDALFEDNRHAISDLSNNIENELKQNYFLLTSPMQASFILYGIQQDLLKIELLALRLKE